MNKTIGFKGVSYYELIDFFDLRQKDIPVMAKVIQEDGTEKTVELFKKRETETLSIIVNGNKVTFEVNEPAEVELIKLKKFLHENEANKEVANAIRAFMRALIKQSEELDYNSPGFKGILEIEDESAFMEWVIENVENMWV